MTKQARIKQRAHNNTEKKTIPKPYYHPIHEWNGALTLHAIKVNGVWRQLAIGEE